MRVMGPPFLPDGDSAYFLAINRNKKSVALDLTKPAGRAVFLDLAAKADVVWENFRPGVMERLGLSYAALAAVNPRPRHVLDLRLRSGRAVPRLAGLRPGAAGDGRRAWRSPARRAAAPCAWACRWAISPAACSAPSPSPARCSVARAPGRGAHIDLSLLDCQVSLLTYIAQYFFADGRVPRQMGSGHASVVPYQALATQRRPHRRRDLRREVLGRVLPRRRAARVGVRPALRHQPRPRRQPRDAHGHDRGRLHGARRPTSGWRGCTRPVCRSRRSRRGPRAGRSAGAASADGRRRSTHPVHGALPTLGTPIKVDGAARSPSRGRRPVWGSTPTRCWASSWAIPKSAWPRCVATASSRERACNGRPGGVPVNVAILGGGNGSYATAADLALAGHRVRLWRRSASDLAPLQAAGAITLVGEGREGAARLDRATADLAEALDGAEVVIVPLPATAHGDLAKRLVGAPDRQGDRAASRRARSARSPSRAIWRGPVRPLPFAFAETRHAAVPHPQDRPGRRVGAGARRPTCRSACSRPRARRWRWSASARCSPPPGRAWTRSTPR